jgi:hypothetical protein
VSRLPSFTTLLALAALLALTAGCRHANTAQLPKDWPLPRLGLPKDSVVFEGHVKDDVEVADGVKARQWTVFFTCPQTWEQTIKSIEGDLHSLDFLKQDAPPEAIPSGAGHINFNTAYASADGKYLVILVFEEDAESKQKTGGGYYTLVAQVNTPPLPPASDFKPLD